MRSTYNASQLLQASMQEAERKIYRCLLALENLFFQQINRTACLACSFFVNHNDLYQHLEKSS